MKKSLILAGLAVAAACYPGRSVDSTTQLASVTTTFDDSADFASATRYAMPDTVLYIPADEDGDQVPAATQAAILTRIRADLATLGWVEVQDPRANPVDVFILPSVTTTTTIVYDYWWWDYWYWYGGWPLSWGPSYTWWYPPYWYAYSYTTGTLIMSMVDARPGAAGRAGPNLVPVIWTGAVNGVLSGQTTNIELVTAGIDQAFRQSPYLVKGGTPQ